MRCWGLQMHVFTCCIAWEYPRMHRHLHAQSTMINVRDLANMEVVVIIDSRR